MDEITLGSVSLPPDMIWSDEFTWTPAGGVHNYALDGTVITQVSSVVGGRPVTLSGGEDQSWVSRDTVVALKALAIGLGASHVLTFPDGRTMNVRFRFDEEPIEARQVVWRVSTDPAVRDQLQYVLTIKLREI